MSTYLDRVQSFAGPPVTEPRKAARCKLLEEAAEAFAVAQLLDDGAEEMPTNGYFRHDLADELADAIQAAANLAACHGITPEEMDAALTRCHERNHERGRV